MTGIPALLVSIYLWLWLAVSVASVILALHAFTPHRRNLALFVVSFFSTWLTLELPVHHMGVLLAGALGVVLLDGWATPVGVAALALNAVALVLLQVHLRSGRGAAGIMKRTLQGYVQEGRWPRVPASKLLLPFHPARREVRVERDVVYARVAGQSLKLDVYLPATPPPPGVRRPAIVQIHGGAWVIGSRKEQGLPLLYHLASNGWVGINVDYRLSPGATFPDHLVDIKRAIAWLREHADHYGVDPTFIAATGGSAGGHLTALAALTDADSRYQPGFEDADTSVQAAIPVYAVYDFTDRLKLMGRPFLRRVLEPVVMKAFLDEEPERFRDASPLDRIHGDAPPFLIVHGTRDTLAPVEYARLFATALSDVSSEPVLYAEIEGAQHAFDIFTSPRTVRVISGMERFLDEAYRRHRASTGGSAASKGTSGDGGTGDGGTGDGGTGDGGTGDGGTGDGGAGAGSKGDDAPGADDARDRQPGDDDPDTASRQD